MILLRFSFLQPTPYPNSTYLIRRWGGYEVKYPCGYDRYFQSLLSVPSPFWNSIPASFSLQLWLVLGNLVGSGMRMETTWTGAGYWHKSMEDDVSLSLWREDQEVEVIHSCKFQRTQEWTRKEFAQQVHTAQMQNLRNWIRGQLEMILDWEMNEGISLFCVTRT